MSLSLIGKSLLGSPFIQDPKPEWIKIDGVVMGESDKFAYKTSSSKDIGSLLDSLSEDSHIVCVVYDWKTGAAYTKSGFDINDSSDYTHVENFTTFIFKDRIPDNSKTTPTTTPTTTTTSESSSSFVTWKNNNFVCDNKTFYVVGPNVYWLGYTEGNSYPPKKQVIEMFNIAKKMKSTVIRSHTLGISSGKSNSLRPSNNTLNENAWEAIDFAFYTAKQYNIKLICPLTDAYKWANGGYGDFCKTRNVPKRDFWTNIDVRNDFKNFIKKWLNHVNRYDKIPIKNHPALAFIELGNELGNIRASQDSTTTPTKEWLTDITNYIKSIDKNHLLVGPSDECLGSKTSDDFNVKGIDIFSSHFYSKDYKRIDFGIKGAKNVGKPYIIGEYSTNFGDDWFQALEKRNIKGSVFWDLYPHENGLDGGNRVEHKDGETLWYPEDKKKLLQLSNHFRRLQKLSTVSEL